MVDSLNSKLGQIEKLKNSPKEWPNILLNFLVVRLMQQDGTTYGLKCREGGLQKMAGQGRTFLI